MLFIDLYYCFVRVQLQRGTSHVADETKDTGSEVAGKQPPKVSFESPILV